MGDYLFTDADFVNHLFKKHRTVFDKIFDEIKYLYKQVTAGSKEARELEKVKKVFEEAYRAETKNPTKDGGVQFSVSGVGYSNKMFDFGVSQRDISTYVEKAYAKENKTPHIKFLEASDQLVSELSPETDITGYAHALRDNDIRHIKNSHGEATSEKYPVTQEDIAMIPYIVENYDKVFYKTNANGDPGIVFVKVAPNNVIYYVEAITTQYNKEKLLVNKQMIKTGIDEIPNLSGLYDAIRKKQSHHQYLADLQQIRKAYVQDVKDDSSNIIVADDHPNVNTKFSLSDNTYLDAVNRGDTETAQKMVEEAAKKAGYKHRMFHETDADNIHIFDISRGTHGGTDYETPYGIFTKTRDKSIGLGGKQMSLLVKANKDIVCRK